ncbi:hypothetical protein HK100_001771 [Physocladia obscura]|uniref:RNA 3'-terminal-phosphate cyclase (ATP) n=1 Tax=Physocladia obscura TaxID=109957 RepID=A0AAD5SXG6_9FUNG|nr:hypothetical protein HK100_001771 [Physocladia obscura]
MEKEIIDVDGSNGGGQIVRNAIAYASFGAGMSVRVKNIRVTRSPSGLRAQHLTGVRFVASLVGASVDSQIGDVELVFSANSRLKANSVEGNSSTRSVSGGGGDSGYCPTADTGTAGSITLLVQAILPVLLFADSPVASRVLLIGGTNATLAPQFDYLQLIFRPFLARHFAIQFSLKLLRRGFYPRGGGRVELEALPQRNPIPGITLLDRGTVVRFDGVVIVGGNIPNMQKLQKTALALLKATFPHIPIEFTVSNGSADPEGKAFGSGSGILVYATTDTNCVLAGSCVGSPKEAPEKTAEKAVNELIKNLQENGCVDEYLQDQIILFLALANGVSRVRVGGITEHTYSAISLAEHLTSAKFSIEKDGVTNIISCVA